ncbi:hypothetical protein, partial [Streptomyces sp. IBSBF 2394]|uniref:hypothetical protein n=1 Tax=Streptomyces sp. IBSBF 2394 TaxID=2903532 RepID=UPI002FDBD6E4
MLMTNRSIGYDAPGEDVTHDPQLDGISAALGQEEGVIEAQALTSTRIPLRCNFVSRIASPPGARALVPFVELLGTTLRLFLGLTAEEAAQLEHLLDSGEPTSARWEQASERFQSGHRSGDGGKAATHEAPMPLREVFDVSTHQRR